MADLNHLESYDHLPRMPYVQPRFYPAVPFRAPQFEVYKSQFIPRGVTTLDTYAAPLPPRWTDMYQSVALQKNTGQALYGNAPTSGVYTGVQEE